MNYYNELLTFQYNFIGEYGNEEIVVIHAQSHTKANQLFSQFFPQAINTTVTTKHLDREPVIF